MEFEIFRIQDPESCAELAKIEHRCFSHPMAEEQIRSMLRSGTALYYAAGDGSRILGSLWLQQVLDEGYIGNIAVLPEYRRQGIADRLLQVAEQPGLRFLTLEVRAGNLPALALYTKHGYRQVGLRANYYSDPKEDAVLMTKWLWEEHEDTGI